jgi:hypothetical protein
MVLLGATTWWPLSARLAMAFMRHGCRVAGICPPGHPLRYLEGVETLYPYGGFNSIGALRAAIVASDPSLIVPCDDGVVWQLHELHARDAALRPLIEYSLGPAENYSVIRGRDALLHAGGELGIRIPLTHPVTSEEDLKRSTLGSPAVLKLDGTWGGSGVVIVHSPSEAVAAFRRLSRPMGSGMVWKRWLINRDPLAWWYWRRREKPNVSIQQFIAGRPANAMVACWKGEVLGIVTVEVLTSQGATGAATVVRLVKNEEIERTARLLARKFELNGFHGLDFVLEQGTNAPYLIELNPRCTQLGHLRLPGQGDLAGLISAKILPDPENVLPGLEDCVQSSTVAFFPQTFTWNPKSPYLRSGYHDVPWEEPALVRELLQSPWPERQILSRIYHYFRTPKRASEVKFQS